MKSYKCLVCGYIHVGEEPPENCPICDAPKEMFELVEKAAVEQKATGFRCLNCEYIHEGDAAPEICPVCGFDENHFEPVAENVTETGDVDFEKVVILGGGIAALSTAEALRDMNDKISITMITNEEKLTYYRLNLTRWLAGEVNEGELCIHGQYWYDEKRIVMYKNKVITIIDREARVIETGDGLKVEYDRLIIALGAHAFIPPIPGSSQAGVHTVRDIEDAKIIKDKIEDGTRVFIIGGGVLGLETAGALSKTGAAVTVGEGHGWLMPRQLNDKASAYVEKDLIDKGVHVEYDFRTEEIVASDKYFTIKAAGGRQVEADIVILATGVRSNTYLARMAELEVNRGIVVNDYMQTSDPVIYAAGDISEHYGVTYGLWNIAQFQGKIAAMNVLGGRVPFGGVPRSNALKVLDVDVFSIGEIEAKDGSCKVMEKQDDKHYLMMVVAADNKVVGSIAIGYETSSYKFKKIVEEGQLYDPSMMNIG